MKKILLADDHSIVRKGLTVICSSMLGNTDVDEVDSCGALMSALKRKPYTHLILDLVLSDGITLEVIPNVRKLYPQLQILIFSMQAAGVYQRVLANYGIRHFVPKASTDDETVFLVSRFLNNEEPPREESSPEAEDNPFSKLTARELEILYYLLKGTSNGDMANTLGIRFSTVSTLKNRILEKTGVKSLKELSDLALVFNVA
jgi:DNA-binding NarL/FixJ family response regulator